MPDPDLVLAPWFVHSQFAKNHELLAVAIDENGSEYYDITLRRIDPQSNDSARLPDPLLEAVPDAAGEVEIAVSINVVEVTALAALHGQGIGRVEISTLDWTGS